MGRPFAEDTAVSRVGEGRYRASLSETWNLRPLPQGGVVTAIALRAMTEELGHPEQRLRTLHTTYAAQVAHGALTIDVETLRRGRSMSHMRAEVCSDDTDRGHLTTAVFGASRRGFEFTDIEPPPAPPPEQCRSWRDPLPEEATGFEPMPFWTERVEGRTAIGHAPWERYQAATAEVAVWYRFDDPPFDDDGTVDPLALVVLLDTMPGAVAEKLGSSGLHARRSWFAPSVDLTVHMLDSCRSPWLLGHNRARYAGDGYASADMALWDCGPDGTGTPRLVAYATQLFLFRFAD